MVEFFPNIQSRWIKLVVFTGSLIGIYGKKYLDYLEAQNKKPKQSDVVDATPTPRDTSAPTVMALGTEMPVNPNKRF